MYFEIVVHYFHPTLNIAMQDVRNLWLLSTQPVKLITTVHQGNLTYRFPGSRKRVSYNTLKKGLVKKTFVLQLPFNLLPF